MRVCLVVFAREPGIGAAKTRLEQVLSRRECLGLYKAFLQDTVALCRRAKVDCRVIAYDRAGKAGPAQLRKLAPGFIFQEQQGRSLGHRLTRIFSWAKREGYSHTVVIGPDSPDLPLRMVHAACLALPRVGLVLGPSRDGGFFLIAGASLPPGIFKGVRWSSRDVFSRVARNAASLRMRVKRLGEWEDVDDPGSLERLRQRLEASGRATAALATKKLLGFY